MKIVEKNTNQTILVDKIICIENGAYAIYPSDQGSANIGWVLLDDPDNYEFDYEKVSARGCEEFINEDGICYEGDSDFNLYIEQIYMAKYS